MFFFILILCIASPVRSINFTIDGVLALGQNLKYKYNVEVPSEEKYSSGRRAIQQNRDIIILESEDLDSSEEDSSDNDSDSSDNSTEEIKREITAATTKKRFRTTVVSKPKEVNQSRIKNTLNKFFFRHAHSDSKYRSNENHDDRNDFQNESDDEESSDLDDDQDREDNYDENISNVVRFTKPLRQITYTKHKKKGKDKFDSTELWHLQMENKKKGKKHVKTSIHHKKTDEFSNKYLNEQQKPKQINKDLINDFYDRPQGRYKNISEHNTESKWADILKNKTSGGKQWVKPKNTIIEWNIFKNISEGIKQWVIKNDTEVGDKINSEIGDKVNTFKNKTDSIQHWHENINETAQSVVTHIENEIEKLKNKTSEVKGWVQNQHTHVESQVKNKTQSWVEKLKNTTVTQKIFSWQEKLKNETLSMIIGKSNKFSKLPQIELNKNQQKDNYSSDFKADEFYSTPKPVWRLGEYKNTVSDKTTDTQKQISKISYSLQQIKNETQLGLANLYKELINEPQRIKNNVTISSFTKHILSRTLKLFDDMEKRSTEYRWKKKMKYLARSYEDKFNEFLRASKNHVIRTRLGPRKIILNAINVSNRIVKRLLDFMTDAMEKKGLMYNNLTPLMFRSEISKEENWELNRACKKLGICRSPKGFTDFCVDMMLMLLSVPNKRFKSAFTSLIEAAKNTDFAFNTEVNEGIRSKLDYYNRQDVHVQKGMLMIVKNLIDNRNIPLVLYNDTDPTERKLQSTLAFLEIINTLDEKVPNNANNINDWDNMRREMRDWVDEKSDNIHDTLIKFLTHFSNVIKDTDMKSWQIISRNANILFG